MANALLIKRLFHINFCTQNRSAAKQIEYWARSGKMADENPELPLAFIKGIIVDLEENKVGNVSDYKFG